MKPNSVLACIPYHSCPRYIKAAVESLLRQSYRDLVVLVINDGDQETPPWHALKDLKDPRLVRYELSENQGPYFALHIAALASPAQYLLVQDADDESHPERLKLLQQKMRAEHADLALSGRRLFREANGNTVFTGIDTTKVPAPALNATLRFVLPHHGLFRIATLRRLGGYYGGYRMSYDMYLTNLLRLTGRISMVPHALYDYYKRPTSMTVVPATGLQSETRRRVNEELAEKYEAVYNLVQAYRLGKLKAAQLVENIASINGAGIPEKTNRAISGEVARLKKVLSNY